MNAPVFIFDESFGFPGLQELNLVIAGTEEEFAGNAFYEPYRSSLVGEPFKKQAEERHNYRLMVKGRKRVLELGLNGGHLALMALADDPQIEWHCVETCNRRYELEAGTFLAERFDGRFQFFSGDSVHVLPEMRLRWFGIKYDVIILHGNRPLEQFRTDMYNAATFAEPEGWIVLDDAGDKEIRTFSADCYREELLAFEKPPGWKVLPHLHPGRVSRFIAGEL